MTDSEKLDLLLSNMQKMQNDITDIKLTLENEIIKVRMLETDMRELKARIS